MKRLRLKVILDYFILLQTFWKLNVCLTIQFAALWRFLSFEHMEDKPGITFRHGNMDSTLCGKKILLKSYMGLPYCLGQYTQSEPMQNMSVLHTFEPHDNLFIL